jgi:hypothetical protein
MNNNYGNSDIGSSSTGSKSESKTASASAGSSSGSVTAGSASKSSKETAAASSSTEHGVDIKKYLDDAKSMGKNLESQMSTRPYVVLGAVAGVSFVAGSLLGSRIGQLAVAIGIGYAATHFLQDTDVKSLARKATQNL